MFLFSSSFTALFSKWLSPWTNSPSVWETLRERFSTEPCGYKVLLENKDYSVSFQKRHNFDFYRGHMKYRPQNIYIYASPLFFPPMAFHSCTSQWALWMHRAYSQVYHIPSVCPGPLGHRPQRPTLDLMKNGGEVCLWVVGVTSTWVYLKSHIWHDDFDGMWLLTSCCEFMFIKSPEPCSLISRLIYLMHEDVSSAICSRPKSN